MRVKTYGKPLHSLEYFYFYAVNNVGEHPRHKILINKGENLIEYFYRGNSENNGEQSL